jgi:hypothetical protein
MGPHIDPKSIRSERSKYIKQQKEKQTQANQIRRANKKREIKERQKNAARRGRKKGDTKKKQDETLLMVANDSKDGGE